MNKKMKFRLLLVLAFMLAAPRAMAQRDIPPVDFIGECSRRDILYDAAGNFNQIIIGLNETYDNDDSFYEWKYISSVPPVEREPTLGSDGRGINRPLVAVRVYEAAEYTFQLTRISKYGYQREEMTLEIVRPLIVDVRPVFECYSPQEDIHIEDFVIETDPPGFSHFVALAPDSQVAVSPTSNAFQNFDFLQTIHFLVKAYENGPYYFESEKTCKIRVNNESASLRHIDIDAHRIYKAFKGLKTGLQEIIAHMKKGAPAFGGAKPVLGFRFRMTRLDKCCNHFEDRYVRITVNGMGGYTYMKAVYLFETPIFAYVSGSFIIEPSAKLLLPGSGTGDCKGMEGFSAVVKAEASGGFGAGVAGMVDVETGIVVRGKASVDWSLKDFENDIGFYGCTLNGQFGVYWRVKSNFIIGDSFHDFVIWETPPVKKK